jgi:hypothetical protein
VASLCGASEAALLGDRQEIPHLPQLNLNPHLINVSEKGGVDYCFFKQTISSEAIIGKCGQVYDSSFDSASYRNMAMIVCQFSHSSVLGLVLPKNQQRSIGIDGGWKVASKRVCLCGDHKAASRIQIRQPQYGVFGSLADRLVPEV